MIVVIGLFAACATPVVWIFSFIHAYAVKTVFWDEWELVPLFGDLYSGHLTFAQLFAQHNEHRILLPRIVMLGSGVLTKDDNVALMYLTGLLLTGLALLLTWQCARTFGGTARSWVLAVPIFWIVLSPRQAENLLWGWQVQVVMCVVFFVLAAVLLTEPGRRRRRFALAACFAAASTFSFAAGLAVWPVLFLHLLFHRQTRRDGAASPNFPRDAAIWLSLGVVVWAVYFHGYSRPGHHPSLAAGMDHPATTLRVFLAALGDPISFDAKVAVPIGVAEAIVFAVFVWFVRGGSGIDAELLGPALPLILFSLASGVEIAIARSGFGSEAGNPSRYVTLMAPGVVGLWWGALALRRGALRTALLSALAAILLIATFDGVWWANRYGRRLREERRAGAALMRTLTATSPGDITLLYFRRDVVLARLDVLRTYRLNVFAADSLADDHPRQP
jgi:hypothetical protein